MRTVEQFISISREQTGNTRYDSNSGISQRLFVQFLQNAQDALSMAITNANSKYFKKPQTVTIVPGQAKYDYPTDCIVQRIDTIQWMDQLNGSNYIKNLDLCVDKEIVTTTPAYPFGYIPQNDGYILNPPILNGYLKVTYLSTVLKVAKKAGKVKFVTVNTGNVLAAIGLDINEKSYDAKEINDDYYFCVTDKLGNIKAANIPYNSIADGTGVFNLDSYTMGSGETIAVGDYILVGRNTTNVPQFPDLAESYLLKYMNYSAKYGDSSNWTEAYLKDLDNTFSALVSIFAFKSNDIKSVPITNTDLLGM